jgi:UDP-N-acetylglucosamine:LPS N-acetylglucosamine transferase
MIWLILKEFCKTKAILYLGSTKNITESRIAKSTLKLLKNHTLRKRMSERGKELLDGKGADRIFSEIPQEVFNEKNSKNRA